MGKGTRRPCPSRFTPGHALLEAAARLHVKGIGRICFAVQNVGSVVDSGAAVGNLPVALRRDGKRHIAVAPFVELARAFPENQLVARGRFVVVVFAVDDQPRKKLEAVLGKVVRHQGDDVRHAAIAAQPG